MQKAKCKPKTRTPERFDGLHFEFCILNFTGQSYALRQTDRYFHVVPADHDVDGRKVGNLRHAQFIAPWRRRTERERAVLLHSRLELADDWPGHLDGWRKRPPICEPGDPASDVWQGL